MPIEILGTTSFVIAMISGLVFFTIVAYFYTMSKTTYIVIFVSFFLSVYCWFLFFFTISPSDDHLKKETIDSKCTVENINLLKAENTGLGNSIIRVQTDTNDYSNIPYKYCRLNITTKEPTIEIYPRERIFKFLGLTIIDRKNQLAVLNVNQETYNSILEICDPHVVYIKNKREPKSSFYIK